MPDAIQGSHRGVCESEGLRIAACSALVDRLIADFSAADRGYRQFSGIADEHDRALMSDATCQAVQAIGTNLLEMRLHEKDMSLLVGSGLPIPATGSQLGDYEAAARVDQHLGGFFRALGSIVDCLAAAVIGVLLAPRDIKRASHLDLLALDDPRAVATPGQRAAWKEIQTSINEHRASDPAGWLDWAIETRNAIVHRARLLSMLFPLQTAKSQTPIHVVADDPQRTAIALARSVPHLRRRPWLGDLQDLGTNTRVEDIWLLEPASVTLMAMRESLNDLIEAIAGKLLVYWQDMADGSLELLSNPALHRRQQDLPASLREEFGGFTPPIPIKITTGVFHPHDANRMKLAEALWGPGKA
jgi:hypothetical protein